MISRREAVGMLGFGALPLLAEPAKPKRPLVCVLSSALTGVGYAEISEIVKQLGFDGVDVTMMRGGMVEPSLAPVDEVRALESIHGAGLAAPIVTSALRSAGDPWSRTLLALAGRTGVGLCKVGLDRSGMASGLRREAAGLANMGREYRIAVLVQAGAGGDMSRMLSLSDARVVLAGADPAWSGLCLHADVFAAGSLVTDTELRDALPLVKAVTLADHTVGGEPKPLGQGLVDFDKLFTFLGRADFAGPVTVDRTYRTNDEPGALTKDCDFVKKRLEAAYGGMPGRTRT